MKSKKIMYWAFTMLITTLFITMPLKAQVTIGSLNLPNENALLDLRQNADSSSTKGLLFPRVALSGTTLPDPMTAHVLGMTVYNTATAGDVTPGLYYNDGTKWAKVGEGGSKWFYMPSFNFLITSAVGTDTTFDFYGEYVKQFTKSGNTQFVSSNTGATQVEQLYTADQLEYYVTSYADSVIQINSISAAGVMDYKVLSTDVPEGSFINVIFKVK